MSEQPTPRRSDPCYMGQHDRCKSPYCRYDECSCGAAKAALTCGNSVESGTKRGPDRANESDPLATVSTRPKGA